MKTVFLAWRDPSRQTWYPVGRLTYDGIEYRFVYTKGVQTLRANRSFGGVSSFPDLDRVYESRELFPVFANRLLPASRPDYLEFLSYLGVSESEQKDNLLLLERSGGRKATDDFEVFALPSQNGDGLSVLKFFAHGLRHLPKSSKERIHSLKSGEELLVVLDIQNPYDLLAIMLRTNDRFEGDRHFVGFCPRYMCRDIYAAFQTKGGGSVSVTVEGVNLPPAPQQFRLRCKMLVRWPENYVPFNSDEFLPVVNVDEASLFTA